MKDMPSTRVNVTTEPTTLESYEKMTPPQNHLDIPNVNWYKDPGLRKLYLLMPVLFLGATINGYDGSLLNGLQTMDPWQECMYSQTSKRY